MFLPSQNLLFIHIPRTAGSSIEMLLWDSIKTKPYDCEKFLMGWDKKNNIFRQHATYNEALFFYGLDPKFSFSVVRNPYTKIVSEWQWFKLNFSYSGSLMDFIKRKNTSIYFNKQDPQFYRKDHFLPQKDFIVHNNSLTVDLLGRHENLYAFFDHICDRFSFKHKNWSKNLRYNRNKSKNDSNTIQDFHNAQTKDEVYARYKEDFLFFGYEK